MDTEEDKNSADTSGNSNGNNNQPIVSDKSLEIPVPEASLPSENGKNNADTGTTLQPQATPTAATTETSLVRGPSDKSVGDQTKVVINEDILVKNVSAVQVHVDNNNAVSLDNDRQDSDMVQGATASLPQQVLVYYNCNIQIENCKFVQVGDNNRMVIEKTTPQEDAFVNACCELDIDPKTADDITKKLSNKNILEQFAKKMAEYSVSCKIRRATKGCILLELEVPTEADRLQLLRMARDGTFQQVLLETFLPEFAAEGRAVNMNLAIGVRNPSQAMVEELQGTVASSDHEEIVLEDIPEATHDPLSASSQDQPESTNVKHLKQSDDPRDLANLGHKSLSGEELPDVALSKAALKGDVSQKLLSDPDDEEGEITVSVKGYAAAVALGTGAAAAANNHPEGMDDKFLTCDICQNNYEDPRVLPCGHTFCTRCLETWRKRKTEFTCPTCRYEVRLRGADVSSLPPNFQIKALLDFRASQNVKEAYAQCQMCESGAKVEGSCEDCHLFLCKNCITGHGRSPALKDHHITLLDNPTKFCSKHTDLPITLYCQACAKFVCQDCTKNEHLLGPNHDPQEVSKAAQKFTVELDMLVGENKNTADTLEKTDSIITKELTSITTNLGLQKTKIGDHFEKLRAELDKAEQEVTKKLEEMGESQKEPLLKKKKELRDTSKSHKDGVQFCTDMLARGNSVEILTFRQQLTDRLNHLRAMTILYEGLKDQISFKADTETLVPTPGSLSLYNTSFIVPELPVESLPTVIIFRSKESQVESTQVTVTSPGGQGVRLDTTRIIEGVFEAVWTPQTSGQHEVGAVVGIRKRQQYGLGIVNPLAQHGLGIGNPLARRNLMFASGGLSSIHHDQRLTVDVGSNNPVLRFGQYGSQQGQFDMPVDVAVSGDRLYVADTGNQRVQVFDLSGNFCDSFPTCKNPTSVAVQTDGTMIVVNFDEEVMKFSPSGELINKFPLGEYCTKPCGLAVQRDGRVVVADFSKHSIFLFKADGTLVKQVGGQGQGQRQGQSDDLGFVCVDKEDNIIVADKLNHRVQVFDKNLNFKRKFGQNNRQPQDMWSPMGVSADSRGNIVLANLGGTTDGVGHSKKLQVFRPNGTWLSTISSDGDKLNLPHGVAVTEDGHVFVTDTGDHCIRKYRYM